MKPLKVKSSDGDLFEQPSKRVLKVVAKHPLIQTDPTVTGGSLYKALNDLVGPKSSHLCLKNHEFEVVVR